MAKTVGVTLLERVELGMVEDNRLVGAVREFPENVDEDDSLVERPREQIIQLLCEQITALTSGAKDIAAVGVAVPGLVRNGIVEEAPNLPQLKGTNLAELLGQALRDHGFHARVQVLNDADALAAGIAAQHNKLDQVVRVWMLGMGIGFGRYPFVDGVWEGGHLVVSLDDKETYCGCGGRGHLEGIMGHRAMRMRFLDMEPEEVFEAAAAGDERCSLFKRLWHKALAGAIAGSVHMTGPGRFYLTGFNVRFVDLNLLKNYTQQMVKMSPLQSFTIETVTEYKGAAVLGAGIVSAMEG